MKSAAALFAVLVFSAPSFASASESLGLSGGLETSREIHFYKDPTKAFLLGLFPGILVHGYGHFYAKDKTTGTALLAGEVLSVIAIGLGAAMDANPRDFSGGIFGSTPQTERAGRDILVGGVILFGVTWLADMVHAPVAAKSYNDEHELSPVARFDSSGSPTFALAVRF